MLDTTNKLTIWQQNINKLPSYQHNLLSNSYLTKAGINIIALQEPAINAFNCSIASKDWIPVYLSMYTTALGKTCSLLLISMAINTDNWEQINMPSGDITAAVIRGHNGSLLLYNIYNNGNSNNSLSTLMAAQSNNISTLANQPSTDPNCLHMIWLRDFNRHHPVWDDPNDTHLFTDKALLAAEKLIEAVTDAGLDLVLLAGIPTHIHNVMKCWTRLDQVFLSDHSLDALVVCDTQPNFRGVKIDHLPIVTELDLSVLRTRTSTLQNFKEVDWSAFQKDLITQLDKVPPMANIQNQGQLDRSCKELTEAIQQSIRQLVPISEICAKSKRWWTKELTMLRKRANKLGRSSYKLR